MGLFSRFGKNSNPPAAGEGSATPLTAEQQQQRQRELAREAARKIDEIEAAMAADLFPSATPAAPVSAPASAQPAAPAAEEDLPHAAAAPETAAVVDEVAILYAQGQLELAAELLRNNLQGSAGRDFWWLLFDLYQLDGQRDAFDALSLDYARRFETSPPGWTGAAPAAQPLPRLTLGSQHIASAEEQASLLATLRASPPELRLSGAEALLAPLRSNLAADTETPWLLVLELLQRLGREEEFDQLALDYCITFEVSPPAFRPVPTKPATGAGTAVSTASSDSFELPAAMHAPLAGLQSRIIVYAAQHPRLIFDASRLQTLDYLCAQQLLACLGNLSCTSIEFRNVNHLVAALLHLLGFATLARIVPRQY
ncbi:hypothetical protein ACFFKC_07055 [Pseudoduganella danionis]|uniref:STAS domain-containing protein n=1 Tax=Pseudoduganella danionis TaxID=1890295 RepID=A0ABW9SPC5_9BURK|nr:hypothetical protein [Pseudoduganella danionis]MTW34037.1 hypothetical protein [Pseudoduganella danionis]